MRCTSCKQVTLRVGEQMERLPRQNYAFLVDIFAFLRRQKVRSLQGTYFQWLCNTGAS